MKLVMTLMVRDEADIIDAMLKHHFAQGVDHVIVTDNGSVDGTTEILESYAKTGSITLHRDPRHEKQQAEVVTRMAREAATNFQATWVLNADADEFWVAEDPEKTLRQAFDEIPVEFGAFEVPVYDMTGAPAFQGSGLSRLIYRDRRPVWRLNQLGHHAHATNDVAFVANEQVEVVQGNHAVSIESKGRPALGKGVEVLHLPWRSWKQLSRKVENAGLAYERSGLTPSPNHHGMRDFQRLRSGMLFGFYLARHPDEEEFQKFSDQLVADRRLADTLSDPIRDIEVPLEQRKFLSAFVEPLVSLQHEVSDLKDSLAEVEAERASLSQKYQSSQQYVAELELAQQHHLSELQAFRSSSLFRLAHQVGKVVPGWVRGRK